MKEITYFLELPYTKVLKRDEEGDVIATIAELDGCIAHGADEAEALANLRAAQTAWIEHAVLAKLEIPMPSSQEAEALPSGRWVQRVSRSLHRSLIDLARAEATSLNQLVATVLAEAVGRRRAVPRLDEQMQRVRDAAWGHVHVNVWPSRHADVSDYVCEADWLVSGAQQISLQHLQRIASESTPRKGKTTFSEPTSKVGVANDR
jgi:antitoxin HicB